MHTIKRAQSPSASASSLSIIHGHFSDTAGYELSCSDWRRTYTSSETSVSVDTGFFSERKTKPLPRGKSANKSNTDILKEKPTASVRGGEERSNTSRGSANGAKPKEPTIAEASSYKTGTIRKSTVGFSRANNITDGSSKVMACTVSARETASRGSVTGISNREEPIVETSSSKIETVRKSTVGSSIVNNITDGSSKATHTQAVPARGTAARGSASISKREEESQAIAEASLSKTGAIRKNTVGSTKTNNITDSSACTVSAVSAMGNTSIRGSSGVIKQEEPQAIAEASYSKTVSGTIRKSKVCTSQNDIVADGSSSKVAARTVFARGGEGKGETTDEVKVKATSRKRVSAKPSTINCDDTKAKKATATGTGTVSKAKAKQETAKENIKGPAVKQVKKTLGNTNIKATAKVAPNHSIPKEGAATGLTAGTATASADKEFASTSRPLKRKKEEAPKHAPAKKRARVVYSDSESEGEREKRPVTLKQKKEPDAPKHAPSKKKARVVCDSDSEPEDEWDEIINISKPCTTTKATTGRVLKPLSSNSPSKDPRNWELEVIDDYKVPKRPCHAKEAEEEDASKLDEELDAGFLEADMLESEFNELEPCSSSQPYSMDAEHDSNSDDSDSDSDC